MTTISERWQQVTVADNPNVRAAIKSEYRLLYGAPPSRTQMSVWRRGIRQPKYQIGVLIDRVLSDYNY